MTHSCRDKGHCWHEADGTLYSRHSGHAQGSTADCTCCWCDESKTLPLYAPNTARGTINPTLKHGANV